MQVLRTLEAAKTLVLATIVAAASQAIPATANAAEAVHPLSAGVSAVAQAEARELISPLSTSTLKCGVQWKATIPANSSQLWFTYDWNPKNYVNWSIMDDSEPDGGPSLTISNVAVDRNTPSTLTYWLTVVNTSSYPKYFEGRFCYQK